jgi:hypothetical protein
VVARKPPAARIARPNRGGGAARAERLS